SSKRDWSSDVCSSDLERSLADHFNPLAMDPELVKAHDALDREVDKAFGATRKLTVARQRQELLFRRYRELAGWNCQAGPAGAAEVGRASRRAGREGVV